MSILVSTEDDSEDMADAENLYEAIAETVDAMPAKVKIKFASLLSSSRPPFDELDEDLQQVFFDVIDRL